MKTSCSPAVLLVLMLLPAVSQAQPITVSADSSQGVGFFGEGTDGRYQSNVSHAFTSTGSAYSFNLRGDVTAQMSGTAEYFGFQAAAFFTLTTGAAPVQLSDITVSFNGKEVVSGGSTATFLAYNFYRAMVYAPGFGSDFEYATYLPDRTAQGVYVEDLSNALPGTLLAANTDYQLYIDVYPFLTVQDYPSSSSMLGYAMEFGGTVAPFYDGVTVSFTAAAVPEPAAWLLMGAGVAALLARRRRGG